MTSPMLFIDWLGLSLRLQGEPRPIEGHVWQDYSATNVWGRRRILYTVDGDKVCTLLSEPRSRLLNSSAALLEIENEWLYHGGGTDAILERLSGSFWYEVLGVSRVDLCVDFVPDDEQKSIIERLAAGSAYVSGKRNGSGFWSTNTSEMLHADWRGRRIPHCQSWGHKTSAIKWKLYYKTKELLDDGGGRFLMKPYIVDQWRMAGFDVSNVWRLEVSCRHCNDYQLYGQRVDLGVLREERLAFFSSLYSTRFIVRANEGHADRTNDTVLQFLSIPATGRALTQTPSQRLAEHQGRITLLRHLVASLDDEHVYLDAPTRSTVLDAIDSIIRRDALQNYFRAMVGMWFDEFCNSVIHKALQHEGMEVEHADCSPDGYKGSIGPEGRLDLPKRGGHGSMPINTNFEEYDADGMVMPTDESVDKWRLMRPVPTPMYVEAVRVPLPPVGRQGRLLP